MFGIVRGACGANALPKTNRHHPLRMLFKGRVDSTALPLLPLVKWIVQFLCLLSLLWQCNGSVGAGVCAYAARRGRLALPTILPLLAAISVH